MKNDSFKIYIDRLKEGESEKIHLTAPPDFLEIQEQELSFPSPVVIDGEAYLTDDHLVLHLNVKTEVCLPCLICNEPTLIPLKLEAFSHTQAVDELKSPIFDFAPLIREDLLLQIPPFTECHNGQCPQRKEISPYLKKDNTPPQQFPFADL